MGETDGKGADNKRSGKWECHIDYLPALGGNHPREHKPASTRELGKDSKPRTSYKFRITSEFGCKEDGGFGARYSALWAGGQKNIKEGFEETGVVEHARQEVRNQVCGIQGR